MWDRVSVAVIEILRQSQREVARVRRLLAWGVCHHGEAVNIAHYGDGGRGGVGRARFELFDDVVDDHDVLAGANAKPDGFADPDLLAAKVDSCVGALACGQCVIAQGLDESEGFVDGFGGEYAAVHFGVAPAEAAFENSAPVDVVVCIALGGKSYMGRSGRTPCKPGA